MSVSGKLYLNDNKNWYFSGDIIKGRVEIQNSEDCFIRGIYVILDGVACVKWEDLDQKLKHGEIVYFMETFESFEVCVQQQVNLHRYGILHKGRHEYNFNISIPLNIPSTLTTTTGTVKYEIILALDNTEASHKLQQQSVLIHRHLNIDRKSYLLLPSTAHYTQNICWWPCKSKPIAVAVSLSSMAYLPGDFINYSLLIENHTHFCDVKRVSAFIIQTLQYKSQKPKQKIITELCTLNYRTHPNPCPRNSKQRIENTFQLPSDLVASSQENSIIMVGYRFQVLVILNGLHQDGSIVVPLTIGSHRDSACVGEGDVAIAMTDLSSKLPSSSDMFDSSFYTSTSAIINEKIV